MFNKFIVTSVQHNDLSKLIKWYDRFRAVLGQEISAVSAHDKEHCNRPIFKISEFNTKFNTHNNDDRNVLSLLMFRSLFACFRHICFGARFRSTHHISASLNVCARARALYFIVVFFGPVPKWMAISTRKKKNATIMYYSLSRCISDAKRIRLNSFRFESFPLIMSGQRCGCP